MSELPIVGISMGDAAGIGPELCLRMLADGGLRDLCRLRVYGSYALLLRVAQRLVLPMPEAGAVEDDPFLDADAVQPGVVQAACGAGASRCVERVVEDAVAGRIAAVVTAPLHKAALHAAGIAYPGHTEMLAALTGAPEVCMMMASPECNVCLVTTHEALLHVPRLVTRERVEHVMLLAHRAMQQRGVACPRITVCGLNPHAGEQGAFGFEERDIVEPAIRAAVQRGLCVRGPLPGDTAFLPSVRAETDVYVVMYHDQGLIPFKMLAFDTGVNVTLGLPIIRTSPDHGTAFDLAWKGIASDSSMRHAILLAVQLAGI